MLNVDNCGHWVSKRNFKVENFLRKHLNQKESGCPRYYETCVIDQKGSLLLRNIILTDQCILLSGNPPKRFLFSIHFSDIQNISLVADRKTLIKGGNNNSYICQHVQILYKACKEKKENVESSKGDGKTKTSVHQHETESNRNSSSYENLSGNGSEVSGYGTWSSLSHHPHNQNTSNSDGSDFTLTDTSRESSSLDGSYVPMFIYQSYEPIVVPPRLGNRPEISKSSSEIPFLAHKSNNNLNGHLKPSSSSEFARSESSSSGSLMNFDTKEKYARKESSRKRDEKKSLGSQFRDGSESKSDNSDLDTGRESLYGIFKKEINNKSHENRPTTKGVSSTREVIDSSRANNDMEQRSSWTKGLNSESEESIKNNKLEERKSRRRPRSVDISQLSILRKKLFGKVFGKETSLGLGESHNKSKGSTPQLVRPQDPSDYNEDDDNSNESTYLSQDGNLQVLNLYLYQPNSALLNELFLFWNRNYLKCTLQMEDFGSVMFRNSWSDGESKFSSSLHAAEKVFLKLSRTWSPVDHSVWTTKGGALCFTVILPKLCTLHKALMKYHHLKRICWKNWDMLVNLLGILRRCMTKTDITIAQNEEDEDYFLESISAYAIIMDIFRLLYETSGTSWFIEESKANDLTNNNNNYQNGNDDQRKESEVPRSGEGESIPSDLHQLTSCLVQIILESDIIPHIKMSGGEELIKIIVCSPQKFATGRWLHYPDSKTIKAITMAHNASVTLLHEILSIVHFSSKDNERAKFMSYLQHCPMETYVKLSMTQVINFLWSNGLPAGSSQAVLLYRHVTTLQTLFQTVSYLKSFVQESFCEEFRYFVHRKSPDMKIPDRFPLKPKLLTVCEELRQEIIGK